MSRGGTAANRRRRAFPACAKSSSAHGCTPVHCTPVTARAVCLQAQGQRGGNAGPQECGGGGARPARQAGAQGWAPRRACLPAWFLDPSSLSRVSLGLFPRAHFPIYAVCAIRMRPEECRRSASAPLPLLGPSALSRHPPQLPPPLAPLLPSDHHRPAGRVAGSAGEEGGPLRQAGSGGYGG